MRNIGRRQTTVSNKVGVFWLKTRQIPGDNETCSDTQHRSLYPASSAMPLHSVKVTTNHRDPHPPYRLYEI